MLDVSIILVSYNTKELTKNCLSSIYEKTVGINYNIFVVDNNSQDGSCELIKELFPDVILIQNSNNLGFGAANNIAISKSKAKYIFLLNTDTILVNNAIKIFYDFMEDPKNNKMAVCGGNLLNLDFSSQHSYGKLPSLKRLLFMATGLCIVFKKFYNKLHVSGKEVGNNVMEVEYVTGADMFIRKSALEEVGTFDEDFFLYFEESELSYRLTRSGYKSVIIPEAKIIHLFEKSYKTMSSEKFKIYKQSELLYFEKCHGKQARKLAKILNFVVFSYLFGKGYFERLKIIASLT